MVDDAETIASSTLKLLLAANNGSIDSLKYHPDSREFSKRSAIENSIRDSIPTRFVARFIFQEGNRLEEEIDARSQADKIPLPELDSRRSILLLPRHRSPLINLQRYTTDDRRIFKKNFRTVRLTREQWLALLGKSGTTYDRGNGTSPSKYPTFEPDIVSKFARSPTLPSKQNRLDVCRSATNNHLTTRVPSFQSFLFRAEKRRNERSCISINKGKKNKFIYNIIYKKFIYIIIPCLRIIDR